jgi:hypothetical protein
MDAGRDSGSEAAAATGPTAYGTTHDSTTPASRQATREDRDAGKRKTRGNLVIDSEKA